MSYRHIVGRFINMKNFINTEFENMTEEEIFMSNEKLIKATIFKKFPNHRSYCQLHMIELDDLIQHGSIGLLYAIRTYDSSNNSSFRSYAINNIAWHIQVNTRKESLRNTNTRTSELVGMVSVEDKLGEQEGDMCVLDMLESNNNTSEEAEENILLEKIIKMLEQDEDVDNDMLYILIARAKGQSMQSIADHFGFHRNSISQKLRTSKAERIKERIRFYLKNGDIQ